MSKQFYITTTLPYVNGEPHVGFALEITEADAIARFHKMMGDDVVFNTGTDEHGVKIFNKAHEMGKTPKEYTDEMSVHFKDLKHILNISYTNFIRTTDPHHIKSAQYFWELCKSKGDIYKKEYQTKYCVGCELEKTDSELVDGKCPDHSNLVIEFRQEENYFFRFSKYQQDLLDLYDNNPHFVVPAKRLNEIRSLVKSGLNDFSVSRLREKMPWGIAVPGDEAHVMYVWFDALVNYISTLGWPEEANFENFWPGVQIAGKDNLRQQSAMWQAMLLSAGIAPSSQILINGFIVVDGQKMSKSLGNVISPKDLVDKFGQEGTRYLLLSLGNLGDDFDISWDKLKIKYNADLANNLGNLVSRVVKLSENISDYIAPVTADKPSLEFINLMSEYRIFDTLKYIWNIVDESNKLINETELWLLVKNNPKEFESIMGRLLINLSNISLYLQPFLPETSDRIREILNTRKPEPLFPRI